MNRLDLPAWLQSNDTIRLPAVTHSWKPHNYLEKTLKKIHAILSEDNRSVLNNQDGLLQKLEPHMKVTGLLTVILLAALTQNLVFLIMLNSIILFAALQSRIRLGDYFVRIWLPIFFFTGIAVLPGIINWVTPGDPLYTIYSNLTFSGHFFTLPAELTITRQGVKSALFVILRSAASLGIAMLLIKTTRWSVLTKVLAKYGLSNIIVTILDMTYRYIYLFLFIFMDYVLGRKSRLVGLETQSSKIAWIGGTISDFLRITLEYSQDIQYALESRGYTGIYYAEAKGPLHLIDFGFAAAIIILGCYAYGGINHVWIFSL
ncbi:cobalt/nickel transport system permease protein [Propionispira arboris]|uniref:Cobalt/nickel transport system permease protein n=1 Tax=Propionispira arboris TaxID=84035 RepID=A0A1H6ZRQ9_9FIRM|nr:cobalt ECF transporter T component CbiQ [Propionispira arboris]SEJ51465.1 cobalt/nickel transport system permease protein [Propionispira arboris]